MRQAQIRQRMHRHAGRIVGVRDFSSDYRVSGGRFSSTVRTLWRLVIRAVVNFRDRAVLRRRIRRFAALKEFLSADIMMFFSNAATAESLPRKVSPRRRMEGQVEARPAYQRDAGCCPSGRVCIGNLPPITQRHLQS